MSLVLATGIASLLHAEAVELERKGDNGGTFKKAAKILPKAEDLCYNYCAKIILAVQNPPGNSSLFTLSYISNILIMRQCIN